MKPRILIAAVLCLGDTVFGLTRREVFSNSAVYLSSTCRNSVGTGFLLFRPEDPSNQSVGKAFLVTNKHVIPAEGAECGLFMRVSQTGQGTATVKMVNIKVVGKDGKYLDTIRLAKNNDIAAIDVTSEVAASGMPLEFVPTGLLGTKDRLKGGNVALVGDEIYMIGFPAGLYDERNASPIWRIGIIATSPLAGYAFTPHHQKVYSLPSFIDGFLVDAPVYPGSSGSAVVAKPQPTSFDSPGSVTAGGPRSITFVLGLISNSIPIADFDGKFPARIGIGIVQSADAVNDTIESFFKN